MSVGAGFIIAMAAAPTDITTATSGDVVVPRRRGKSKAPNFTYEGPVSVIRLELDVPDAGCPGGCSDSGRRCFGYGGHCSATPKPGVGRTGPPTVNAPPTPKRCGSGWACPAKESRPRRSPISRPVGGCVIT